jgi:hypothetical protein
MLNRVAASIEVIVLIVFFKSGLLITAKTSGGSFLEIIRACLGFTRSRRSMLPMMLMPGNGLITILSPFVAVWMVVSLPHDSAVSARNF